MQQYFAAIQNNVCQNCKFAIYGENRQFFFCGLPQGKTCAIKRFLPEVVEVVESFDVPSPENQIVELRCKVCSKCDQFKCGSCPLTGIGDCTLEHYFPQVVEAIRKVSKLAGINGNLKIIDNR